MGDRRPLTVSDVYVLVAVVFGLSIALADYTIRALVFGFDVRLHGSVVAALTEPFTTKLAPAIAVVALVYRWTGTTDQIAARPTRLATVGGLSVGVFERIGYVWLKGAAVTPLSVVPVLVHTLTGVLVAGAVFRSAGSEQRARRVLDLAVALALAVAIHVFWNVWYLFLQT